MFKQLLGLTCLFAGLLLFSQCGDTGTYDLRDYYFPVDSLANGRVYEYRSPSEENDPPFYWYYRSIEQDGQLFLAAMFYDADFSPYQVVREEVVESGIILHDFFLYEPDTADTQKQVPVEVIENSVFPFHPSEVGAVYVYNISWSMPSDSGAVTSLIRNRQFMGDTSVVYQGERYDAVNFYVRELIDIENEGHTEHEYDGWEIYAKGLGLVYTRKNVADDFVIEYELQDRYPMTELETRFEEAFPLDDK
jgi:hypothetical protein